MVLAPFGPTVVVDSSGPNSQSGMRSAPVSQGGTIAETETDSDLTPYTQVGAGPGGTNIIGQLQGPVPQNNPYQEVNLFIGEFCRIWSAATGVTIAPMAAWARIRDIGNTMFASTYHA